MSFIYVASPYSHDDPKIMEQRYKNVAVYVLELLNKHKYPYSPIVSCHRFAQEFQLLTDANSWMNYNFAMLSSASELHVLQLPGWNKSIGVTAEVAFWRGARPDRPIIFVEWKSA